MGAITLTEYVDVDKVIEELKALQDGKLRVGVVGAENSTEAQIATAHEFGAEIKPKKGKYLAIPANGAAKGKYPKDFPDLIFIKNKKNDSGRLVRKDKNSKNSYVYFWLVKKVEIPERSYIRSTLNDPKQLEKPSKFLAREIENIVLGKSTAKKALAKTGLSLAGQIKTKMVKENIAPPISGLTRRLKNSNHALIDSGRLKNSIGFEVIA